MYIAYYYKTTVIVEIAFWRVVVFFCQKAPLLVSLSDVLFYSLLSHHVRTYSLINMQVINEGPCNQWLLLLFTHKSFHLHTYKLLSPRV